MMSEDMVGNQLNVELHEAHMLSEASSVSLCQEMTVFIWLAWVVTGQYQRTLKNQAGDIPRKRIDYQGKELIFDSF